MNRRLTFLRFAEILVGLAIYATVGAVAIAAGYSWFVAFAITGSVGLLIGLHHALVNEISKRKRK